MAPTTPDKHESEQTSVEERWSPEKLEECLALFDFDDAQRCKMLELQTLLADMDHWKNDPYEVARYLVDFREVKKAHKMFRKMVEWRRHENADHFVQAYCELGLPQIMMDHVPIFLLDQVDYGGHPIYAVRVGAMDAWGLYQAVGTKAILEYTRFVQEITTTRDSSGGLPPHLHWQPNVYETSHQKRRLTQFTMLVDLQGLSQRHLRPQLFGILQQVARCAQDHYAGFGKRIIILRAPAIFQWAWRMIKHFFDPHIQELITFTTCSDYLDVCAQYMDIETALPPVLYDKGQGQAMPGFFERVRQEGGRVVEMPSKSSHSKDDTEDLLLWSKPMARKDTADMSVLDDLLEDEYNKPQEPSRIREDGTRPTAERRVTASTKVLFRGEWDMNHHVQVSV